MELQDLFRNYSPIKFRINNDVISRLQQNNPIVVDYDDIAYNKMASKISYLLSELDNKKKFINDIPSLFIKTLSLSFLILYLFSPKLCILSHDDENTKQRKPKYQRIIFISFIISIIYILNFTKNNVFDIIYSIFG